MIFCHFSDLGDFLIFLVFFFFEKMIFFAVWKGSKNKKLHFFSLQKYGFFSFSSFSTFFFFHFFFIFLIFFEIFRFFFF